MDTFSKKLRYLKLACIVVFCLVAIISCSNGDGGDSIPQLSYDFTEAPIDLTGITADFSADVAYGDAENNIFDIYLPDSYEPTPLVETRATPMRIVQKKSANFCRTVSRMPPLITDCSPWIRSMRTVS